MKLEVVDSKRYGVLKGISVDSIYPVLENEWHCNAGSLIIIIQFKSGIVTMGIGESEYEAKDTISILAKVPDLYRARVRKINVSSIIEFMDWEIDEENYF